MPNFAQRLAVSLAFFAPSTLANAPLPDMGTRGKFLASLNAEQKGVYLSLHGDDGSGKKKSFPEGWYPSKDDPIDGSVQVEFSFMESFMLETFKSVGVPASEAAQATDVLIEADKRGITSHGKAKNNSIKALNLLTHSLPPVAGIGRLKPIYVDRLDDGILKPTAPITVVKETAAAALVDGNLGLGLTVGPHCMRMAIAKAKECGVGIVISRNSTHYGTDGSRAESPICLSLICSFFFLHINV